MNKLNLDKAFWLKFFNEFVKESRELYQNKGINYDIPNEAQIRSVLYTYFRQTGALVELESDLFNNNLKVVAKFDMRVVEDINLLIEVKRSTALTIWNNDYSNFLVRWKADIDKLTNLRDEKYIKRVISEKTKHCFVLFVFKDSEKHWEKLKAKIDMFLPYIDEKLSKYDLIESDFELLTNKIFGIENEKKICTKMYVWIEQ